MYVNEQALAEAEEIRKTIQKAVAENTFIEANEQVKFSFYKNVFLFLINFIILKDPAMEFNPPAVSRVPPFAFSALPNWYEQMQKLWQDWAQSLFKGFYS